MVAGASAAEDETKLKLLAPSPNHVKPAVGLAPFVIGTMAWVQTSPPSVGAGIVSVPLDKITLLSRVISIAVAPGSVLVRIRTVQARSRCDVRSGARGCPHCGGR